MIFSHAYLFAPGGARLVYTVAGGCAERAFPAGKQAPEDAISAEWDADSLTLTLALEDGGTTAITLTAEDIEDAKATAAL